MRRKPPSHRIDAPAAVPQRNTSSSLQTGERVRVDEDPTSEHISDRRTIQTSSTRESGDRLPGIVEDPTELDCDTDHAHHPRRRVNSDVTETEVAVDVVTRPARIAGGTGHPRIPYHGNAIPNGQSPLTNTRSIYLTGVSKPRSGDEEYEMAVHRQAGTRVHVIIGAALTASAETGNYMNIDVGVLARQVFADKPLHSTIATSVRNSARTSTAKYLQRCIPAGWTFAGTELRLGRSIADIVWHHEPTGRFLVQEVKTGQYCGIDDDDIADQLARLAQGGIDRWDTNFVGVQLVPLAHPAAAAVWTWNNTRLVKIELPEVQCR